MSSLLVLANRGLTRILRWVRLFSYRRGIRSAARKNPELYAPVDSRLEANHKSYWGALGRVDCAWLRLYVNLCGIEDKRYIPNDIYIAIVERRLNDGNYNSLISDKNYLERLFGASNFPTAVLRRMSGVFLDGDYTIITDLKGLLPQSDLIVKPSINSKGGTGVRRLEYREGQHRTASGAEISAAYLVDTYGENFIIQEMVRQHPFCAGFNPGSVNTFRVYVYRSVADETVHVLKVVFRNGRGTSVVDNQAAGGISCVVNAEGELGRYAVSKDGEVFESHPDSGVIFAGQRVPFFDLIKKLPCDVAARIPSHRALGFDIALTTDNKPLIVEINPMGISLNMMQVDGGPLFGDFTDEVIDYCRRHPGRDSMQIVKT